MSRRRRRAYIIWQVAANAPIIPGIHITNPDTGLDLINPDTGIEITNPDTFAPPPPILNPDTGMEVTNPDTGETIIN